MVQPKKIGCLHAHHGNIAYLDEALAPYEAELAHFVDPALVRRIGVDPEFSKVDARQRVLEQLDWMTSSGLDGIVITCTAYAASLPEGPLPLQIPVLTIDEPFFATICRRSGPTRLVFTNPGTIEGSLRRLDAHAVESGTHPDVTVELIDGAFDRFMAGRQEEHDRIVAERLAAIVASRQFETVAAGQLSLSRAARQIAVQAGVEVINPLDTLAAAVETRLGLRPAVRPVF